MWDLTRNCQAGKGREGLLLSVRGTRWPFADISNMWQSAESSPRAVLTPQDNDSRHSPFHKEDSRLQLSAVVTEKSGKDGKKSETLTGTL